MKKTVHTEGRIGGPCHHIKRDGYWCDNPATVIVGQYGYCDRHAQQAMTYGPREKRR